MSTTDSERISAIRARARIAPDALAEVTEGRAARALDSIVLHDVDWLVSEHDRLTALLAEQAATIERVRALHHPEPVFAFDAECGHDDEEHVTFEGRDGGTLCQDTPTGHACTDCRDELGDPVDWPCLTVRALGSQRTEGQG